MISESKIEDAFSCNLQLEAKKHIIFLQTLHLSGITIQKPSIESLRRYSKLWLPLVYHHDRLKEKNKGISVSSYDEGLIPPNDIAWLWHCHRLAPYRYVKHIQSVIIGKHEDHQAKSLHDTLDPTFPFVVQLSDNSINKTFEQFVHQNAAKYTQTLWEELYPNESFFIKVDDPLQLEAMDNTQLSGFDILDSCERQAAFLWQVSQTNFSNDKFLRKGVKNYYKFIALMKETKKKTHRLLVPITYQIDLMRHTHILHSIKMYHKDCMRIIATSRISILEGKSGKEYQIMTKKLSNPSTPPAVATPVSSTEDKLKFDVVASTPTTKEKPKFDVIENVYEGAKSVWAFGKGIIVLKPFMGVAEGAATMVLSMATGVSSLEDTDKHIQSTLVVVDQDFIDPVILNLWNVLEPIVGKGDETLKALLATLGKKSPMIKAEKSFEI